MISYYLDATPIRCTRAWCAGSTTGIATHVRQHARHGGRVRHRNLHITYDLADGVTNPANVRMTAADLQGTGACAPAACSPNQIRKVNMMLSGRSRIPMRGTRQFFRNRLFTQVSLRSLAFVDRYQLEGRPCNASSSTARPARGRGRASRWW